MEMKIEVVTPEKAADYLTKNTSNRPLSNRHVQKLSTAMANGEWVLNGESVKFNGDGSLIDGQHRLAAIVRANKSIRTYVVRGLDSGTYDTIDQGRARSLADVLARCGEKHYTGLASGLRWYLAFRDHVMVGAISMMSVAAQHQELEKVPELRDSVEKIWEWVGTGSFARGLLIGFHCYARSVNEKLADDFMKAVCTGENLTRAMPEYKLRQVMLDDVRAVRRMHVNQMANLIVKAWNARRSGKELKILKTTVDESRPKIL